MYILYIIEEMNYILPTFPVQEKKQAKNRIAGDCISLCPPLSQLICHHAYDYHFISDPTIGHKEEKHGDCNKGAKAQYAH